MCVWLLGTNAEYDPTARASHRWPAHEPFYVWGAGSLGTCATVAALATLALAAVALRPWKGRAANLAAVVIVIAPVLVFGFQWRSLREVPQTHASGVSRLAAEMEKGGVEQVFALGFDHRARYGDRLEPLSSYYLLGVGNADVIDCGYDLACLDRFDGERAALVVWGPGMPDSHIQDAAARASTLAPRLAGVAAANVGAVREAYPMSAPRVQAVWAIMTSGDMMQTRVILGLILLALASASRASAGTYRLGPYDIGEHAFPDEIVQVAGPDWALNSPHWTDPQGPHCGPVPASLLLLEGPPDYRRNVFGIYDLRSDITFELRFVNNTAVNLPGPDLVFFQMDQFNEFQLPTRAPGGYMIALQDGAGGFGAFHTYPKELAVPIGETWGYILCGPEGGPAGFPISMIEIDLSDHGVVEGTSVSALRFSSLDLADPLIVVAIHSELPVAVESATWGRIKAMYRH